ncbi:MAG TPA: hypothetical protein VH597_03865 [Verrucomicrobiae bacterium]|jgi:hypothetical protein|nr:hypothetical protein [Verrucomicrobiae bacterium]
MGPLLCSRSFRFFLIAVWLCFADVVMAQDQSPANAGQPALTYPYDQPWGPVNKNSSKAQQSPTFKEMPKSEPATPPAQPPPPPAPPAAVEAAAPVAPSSDMPVPPAPSLTKPVVAKSEVSVSADFFDGEGTVTVPIGFSLRKTLGSVPGGVAVQPTAGSAPRSSQYFGGTISYSYLHAWYVDLSYEDGTSSGNANFDAGNFGNINSDFSIKDQWYQAYLRYTFPALRGKRLSAYLRAGASYVDADLDMNANTPEGKYTQKDKTQDILGNGGFGIGYSLYASRRFIISLQVEGEGFFGQRSQQSRETLSSDAGLTPKTDNIDNTLYGGIARGTARFEYRLGQANRFRVFAEGGAQGKITEITYPGAGTFSEDLWGPYVKVGLRYSF